MSPLRSRGEKQELYMAYYRLTKSMWKMEVMEPNWRFRILEKLHDRIYSDE